MFQGSGSAGVAGGSRARRAAQLRRGIAGAAAALPATHAALAESAVEAAEQLVVMVRAVASGLVGGEGAPPDGAGPQPASGGDPALAVRALEEAVALLEILHFHLVKAAVQGVAPEELGVPEEVEEARRLAERLGELVEGSAGGGGGRSAGR